MSRVIFEQIPKELREKHRWCVWRSSIGNGDQFRAGKFPCSPSTGRMIRVNEPSEWTSFDAAADALRQSKRFAGLGILLQPENEVVGIDLDDCVTEDHLIKPWAMEVLHKFRTYAEVSPSLRGIKIFARGRLPPDVPKRSPVEDGSIEIYDRGRFFTVTGLKLQGTLEEVGDCQMGIDWLASRFSGRESTERTELCEIRSADLDVILNECPWMRHCQRDASVLSEPEWYAMLGIGGRCQDGEKCVHELSRTHPNYTFAETAQKLSQALEKAGPRTCSYIAEHLGQSHLCHTCVHWTKIRSPIVLGMRTTTVGEQWPEPRRLDCNLAPVQPFDARLLPHNFRPYALDLRERMQVPMDFVAAPLMVALGGAAGRRALIRPKEHDDWIEASNLWGGLVSEPGAMKTPTINEVFKFLHAIETEFAREFDAHQARYQQEVELFEARQKAWKHEAARLAARGDDLPAFDQIEPVKPVCRRILVNDSTPEKMQIVLAENPGGVLLFRDEIAGWFASMDAEGRETDRPFYLETWNGSQSYTVDRIGRGTIRAAKLCLSVFGGVQPNVLRRYLLATIVGGSGDDGFAQRLQLVVYPDQPDQWTYVDRAPDFQAREIAARVFQAVAAEPPEEFVAKFDPRAQAFHTEWRTKLENRLRNEPMPTYLKSHLAKYRGLMPRLSLLCHLADSGFDRFVSLEHAERAAGWCEYLESHARRIYAEASPRSMASVLGDKIQSGALGVRFTVREILKKGWSGLDRHTVVMAILQELVEANWVKREPPQSRAHGGRPAEAFLVNPKVLKTAKS